MEPRLERNVPALTEEACALLQQKRVLVAGCGGLGGHIIDQLARVGVGALRLVDGDSFDITNMNRQLLCRADRLGMNKARVAAEHVRQIGPQIQAEAVEAFIDMSNADTLIAGCDAVVDGLDNIHSRHLLSSACEKAGIPYIYGGVCGWIAQAALCLPGDGLIQKLFPEDTSITDRSILSFTPALCAALQTALCVKALTGQTADHGKLYYFDLRDPELEIIPMI